MACTSRKPTKYSFTYATYPGPDVHAFQDVKVPVAKPDGEVTIRIYSPPPTGKPLPVHFNMHGGGWVLGGLGSEQAWCRHVCNNVGIKVIDIDYRLAPEIPFPSAIYECWAAIKFVLAHASDYDIDPTSVSIGGLSAGGHMTAVLSQFARDERIPLKLQLMVVPFVDLRWEIAEEPLKSEVAAKYPSVTLFADNPWGPRSRMTWFMDYWIGTDKARRAEILDDWVASPILAPSLVGLAPAHLVTAEMDLSRDETEEYGRMLVASGVPTTTKRYLGMPRSFGHYNHPEKGLKQSHQYILDTGNAIKSAHGL